MNVILGGLAFFGSIGFTLGVDKWDRHLGGRSTIEPLVKLGVIVTFMTGLLFFILLIPYLAMIALIGLPLLLVWCILCGIREALR